MQLFQEGRLKLIDPLTKYFPKSSYGQAQQTQIKHLLNHTSGLGDYRDSEEYLANVDNYTCITDVLPLIFQLEPAFVPGERSRYSNAGVLLLKAIIEQLTGLTLQEALQQRIFHPLGMDGTAFLTEGDVLANRATAYSLTGAGDRYRRVLGEPAAYTGGGIYTTVLDLLKFDQALYDEILLSEENKQIMFTPVEPSPNYAYGWQVVEFGGTTVIYHGGGSGGFNSTFRRYPEKGLTIIVLSNYETAAFELANKIDCMLLDLPYTVATEADFNHQRGMYFQDQRNFGTALEYFHKNIDVDVPHLPSVYQAARTRIFGEFEQEKAIEVLDKYIELADESTRPSIAAAWWRKGVAWEQLGEIKKALHSQKKCLELHPGYEYATEALARLEALEK